MDFHYVSIHLIDAAHFQSQDSRPLHTRSINLDPSSLLLNQAKLQKTITKPLSRPPITSFHGQVLIDACQSPPPSPNAIPPSPSLKGFDEGSGQESIANKTYLRDQECKGRRGVLLITTLYSLHHHHHLLLPPPPHTPSLNSHLYCLSSLYTPTLRTHSDSSSNHSMKFYYLLLLLATLLLVNAHSFTIEDAQNCIKDCNDDHDDSETVTECQTWCLQRYRDEQEN
ncbi:uncharacterized protein VTP21DRAFT_3433 [Calcarisporiella thermophila]|uniref:uncharacterized protein n=1 Tax=Calcarisporiella thermophila TaxID=911321 RepID=UPI003741FA39